MPVIVDHHGRLPGDGDRLRHEQHWPADGVPRQVYGRVAALYEADIAGDVEELRRPVAVGDRLRIHGRGSSLEQRREGVRFRRRPPMTAVTLAPDVDGGP